MNTSTSTQKRALTDQIPPDVNDTYVSGDGSGLGRKIVGLTKSANPTLAAILSTSSAQSIVTGAVRLCKAINDIKNLQGKELAYKTTDVSKHVLVGLNTTLAVVEVTSGVVGTVGAGFTMAALQTATKAAVVVAPILGKIGGGVGLALYTIMAIPHAIKAVKTLILVKQLGLQKTEDLQSFYEEHKDALNEVAPKAFNAIKNNSITPEDVKNLIKEARGNAVLSILVIAACVISILGVALGLALSAGPGLIVAAVVSLIATLSMTGIDGYSMIQSLREKTRLSDKDLIVKIVIIALAAVTLVLAVYFAPTLALAALGGIIGGIMIAVPMTSIIVLKIKEEHAKKITENAKYGNTKKEQKEKVVAEAEAEAAENARGKAQNAAQEARNNAQYGAQEAREEAKSAHTKWFLTGGREGEEYRNYTKLCKISEEKAKYAALITGKSEEDAIKEHRQFFVSNVNILWTEKTKAVEAAAAEAAAAEAAAAAAEARLEEVVEINAGLKGYCIDYKDNFNNDEVIDDNWNENLRLMEAFNNALPFNKKIFSRAEVQTRLLANTRVSVYRTTEEGGKGTKALFKERINSLEGIEIDTFSLSAEFFQEAKQLDPTLLKLLPVRKIKIGKKIYSLKKYIV